MPLKRRHINEESEKQLGYCQAVKTGNMVFISGTVSWDASLQPLHVGDIAAQIRHVYETLEKTLAQFDLNFSHVVKETGYVVDIDSAMGALAERAPFYADGKLPTSTWVEVSRLAHPDLLIEIELVAAT